MVSIPGADWSGYAESATTIQLRWPYKDRRSSSTCRHERCWANAAPVSDRRIKRLRYVRRSGRFIVNLLKAPDTEGIAEARSHAFDRGAGSAHGRDAGNTIGNRRA